MTSLTTRVLFMATTAAVAGLAAGLTRAYRRDLTAAQDRLAAVQRQSVYTSFGTLEYAEAGAGDPVLVSHGIFHGCDGGLLSVRSRLPTRRIIAPSRFGYLGSELPAGATPRDQADAFAALLDRLDLGQVDVVGISAGTTAALRGPATSSSCLGASPAIRWRSRPRRGRSLRTRICRCGS